MHYWDLRGQPGSFSVLSWHIPRTTMRADEITRVLAAQVARLRKAAGWSQAQLAERVAKHRPGWTRSSVTKLENGLRESISVGDLVALALAFDVPPALLAEPAQRRRGAAGGGDRERVGRAAVVHRRWGSRSGLAWEWDRRSLRKTRPP